MQKFTPEIKTVQVPIACSVFWFLSTLEISNFITYYLLTTNTFLVVKSTKFINQLIKLSSRL